MLDRIRSLKARLENLKERQTALSEEQRLLQQETSRYEEISREYDERNRRFICSQAGILALSLEEGGSLSCLWFPGSTRLPPRWQRHM